MSDAEQRPQCDTLGCENTPVEAGYCAECAEISPRVLNENPPEEGHQASAESLSEDDSDPDSPGSNEVVTESPIEARADDQEPPNEPADAQDAFADAIAWFHE